MAIAFVKNGGAAGNKTGAALSATVPAGGHAAGNLVIVVVGAYNPLGTATYSISDSGGNTYTLLHDSGTVRRCRVYGCVLATALTAGQTITVTAAVSTVDILGISTIEFSGASITEDVASAGAGTSGTALSVGPITPPSAATLLIAGAFTQGSNTVTTEDTDTVGGSGWSSGPLASTTGGSAVTNLWLRPGYKITTSSAAQTYNLTLGTIRNWSAALASLQPAAPPTPKSGDDTGTSSETATVSTALGIWNLDESPAIHGTTITDSSGAGNHGTLNTGDGSTDKAVAGQVGGAITFDGVNDRVRGPIGVLNSIGAGDFTILAWVKNTNQAKRCFIVGQDQDISQGRTLMLEINANASGDVAGGAFAVIMSADAVFCGISAAGGTVSPNVWHRIGFRRLSGVLTLWVDGVSVSTTPYTSGGGTAGLTLQPGVGEFQIGSRAYPTGGFEDFFQGDIDKVQAYKWALSDAEMLADGVVEGAKSGSDSGAVTETTILATVNTASDTGTSSETAAFTFPQTISDTGTSTENASVTVPVSGSDTGTGSDETSISRPAADSGTSTETGILTYAATVSDTNGSTETGIAGAVNTVSDTGTSSETASITVPVVGADIGTSSETATASSVNAASDSGTSSETATPVFSTTVSDTGSAVETASAGAPISGSDTGASTDAATVVAQYTQADTGTGSDASILTAVFSLTDSGAVTETSAIRLTLSETGTGADVIATFTRAVFEAGSGLDESILSAGNAKTGTDSGTGSDAGTLIVVFTVSDTGTSSETSAIRLTFSDTGTFTDGFTLSRFVSDFGGIAEAIGIIVIDTDAGVGSDDATAGESVNVFYPEFKYSRMVSASRTGSIVVGVSPEKAQLSSVKKPSRMTKAT